jgi:cytochrome P450
MATYQLTRKKQFGSIFKTNIFLTPTVFVTDDESLQELGVREATTTMTAFFPPHHQKLFGPNSVLVTSGSSHDRIRKLIASSLSPTVVDSSYPSVIHDSVDEVFCKALQTKTIMMTTTTITTTRQWFRASDLFLSNSCCESFSERLIIEMMTGL